MPNLIMEAVPPARTGEATGFNALVRSVGASLGSQVTATIRRGDRSGQWRARRLRYTTAFVVSAGVALVAAVLANSFRDRSENSRDVSRKLNVANLLDGNVRIADNAIRVAVELIDGASGFSKWSTSFDRPLSNLLALDSDVANAVSAALSSRLGKGDQARSRSGGTTIVGAFDAYLRGKELFDSQKDEASDRAALDYFGQSVQLDPEYAAARAARSRSLAVIANQYASTAIERRRLYGEAVTEARRAIASAEGFADAYAALGYALFYGTLDIAAADAPYEKAHELANGSADVLSLYALYRSRRGQFDRARSAMAARRRWIP